MAKESKKSKVIKVTSVEQFVEIFGNKDHPFRDPINIEKPFMIRVKND